MDYFLVFSYSCQGEMGQDKQLIRLAYELVRPSMREEAVGERREFDQLETGDCFRMAMLEIVGLVNQLALEFINVQFVAENAQLFTAILPREFGLRKMSMPYVFTSFVDWKILSCQKYGWNTTSLGEIVK